MWRQLVVSRVVRTVRQSVVFSLTSWGFLDPPGNVAVVALEAGVHHHAGFRRRNNSAVIVVVAHVVVGWVCVGRIGTCICMSARASVARTSAGR